MVYALLLLGLLPLAFLPDVLLGDSDEEVENEMKPQGNENDDGLLSGLGQGPADKILQPLEEDDTLGGSSDPGEGIIDPVIEDDASSADGVLPPLIEDDVPGDLPVPDTSNPLTPVLEDDTDDGEANPDPSEVLPPLMEDDVADGSTDGDVLLPVNEDDPAQAIEATLTDPVEITGFDAQADILRVTINPVILSGLLDVTTIPSANGADTLIFVDKVLIATLNATTDLNASNVYIDVDPASFV